MRNKRALLRKALSGLTGLFLLFVVAPVVSEFFIELAKEQGAYTNPSEKVASAVDWLATITENWWFAFVFGFVSGGTLFMWADHIIRNNRGSRSGFAESEIKEISKRALEAARIIKDHLNSGSNGEVPVRVSVLIISLNKDFEKLNIPKINFGYKGNIRFQHYMWRTYLSALGELLSLNLVQEAQDIGRKIILEFLDICEKMSEHEKKKLQSIKINPDEVLLPQSPQDIEQETPQ